MKRTVQYWRLIQTDGAPLPGRFPAAQVVSRLVQAEAQGLDRHRRSRDGMILIAHGVRNSRKPMLILDKVRRENLPSVGGQDGLRRAIGLSAEEGLLEPTYCLFAEDNVVAMLTSGDGPRPRRLVEYLRTKLDIVVGIEPVLTKDLDRVLNELRISSIDVAIPAHRITRDLVGGDWVEALEAGRQLAQDGVVRVGIAVGRRGTAAERRRIRDRIRERVDGLRGSGGLSEFDSARVRGTINGSPRSIDLMEDRFIEKADVDADRLNDPRRSTSYGRDILRQSLKSNSQYLATVIPPVGTDIVAYPDSFIEIPDDERQ